MSRGCARSSSPPTRRSSRYAASAICSSRAVRSLRLQLLAWLLVPLPALVAINTWFSYRQAAQTATAVQDRMLVGALRIIAEQTYYRAGELHERSAARGARALRVGERRSRL